MFTEDEMTWLRRSFPLACRSIYLNSCSKGCLSTQVRAAMKEYLDSWDSHGAPWDAWLGKIEALRQAFATLIRAQSEEIAVTFCVSTGINAVASALDFSGQRRKIVISADEFPTLAHIWQAQRRRGAKVEFVVRRPGESLLNAFSRAIDEDTLLVVMHQIHHVRGERVPVDEIARVAHAHGAYVFLDAYHSAGVLDLDVKMLEVDFMVTGTMKYLLGSAGGVAFLYVRSDLISTLEPMYTGWFGQRDNFAYALDHLEYNDTAKRFECGLQPVASIYAATAGLNIVQVVGVGRIEQHVTALGQAFAEGARQLDLDVITPSGSHGPMTCIRAKNTSEVIATLIESRIIVASWQDILRFSFHVYNTQVEVDETLAIIGLLRHRFLSS